MKKLILGFFVAVFVFGCAATNNNESKLFNSYSEYKNLTNKNNISQVATQYFSKTLLRGNYQTNPDAASQLLFHDYMLTIDSHIEKTDGLNGCMIINGFDEEQTPIIFSLEYIMNNKKWLISEIHVVFVASFNDFKKEVKCPGEFFS
jgi:ABC-type transport system involved in multi-copper enzyme maturation permease subunit